MPTLFTRFIERELPCFQVYEDEHVFGFLSRDAIRHGHTLLVPRVEVDHFTDVPEPYYSAVFQAAVPVARAIQRVTGCVRVGTVIAGWDIPHFHYHLVPMFEYDDLDPHRAKQYTDQENRIMAEALREALAQGLDPGSGQGPKQS